MEGYAISLDDTVGEEEAATDKGRMHAILTRMPEAERAIFTERHIQALEKACREVKWGVHPVDIRWSFPTLLSRYYVVLLAGPERRCAARRAEEKKHHRVARLGNILFLGLFAVLIAYLGIVLETLFLIGYYRFFGG